MTGALLLAVALSAGPARATASPAAAPAGAAALAHGPVRVDADQAQYAFQRREVTFTGKKPVVLTRDDATLSCRRIVAKTDEAGQIVSASCTGDVRFVRGQRTVTCDEATFEEAAERVVCTGSCVLRDAGSEARGTRLVYDLKADAANLENATITLPGAEIEQRRREVEEKRKARRSGARPEPREEQRR